MEIRRADPRDVDGARAAIAEAVDLIDAMEFEDVESPAAVLLAGWLCAAAEQARLILLAEDAGLNVAVASNRRLLLELALRGIWIAEGGPDALAAFDDAQQRDLRRLEDVMGAGMVNLLVPEIRAEFRDDTSANSESTAYAIKHFPQRRNLSALYLGYWQETAGSHATRGLADRYAKVARGAVHLRFWKEPPEMLMAVVSSLHMLSLAATAVFRLEDAPAALRDVLQLRDRLPDDLASRVPRQPDSPLGTVACPRCLEPLTEVGDDPVGADARLVCRRCGFTAMTL